MPTHRDIPYDTTSGDAKHTLDLYIPSAATAASPAALAVYVHGGSWRSGDKSELASLGPGLVAASNGALAVAVINYRLSVRGRPETQHPMHLEDIKRALAFLTTHAYPGSDLVDRRQLHLVGHSAGAHLVALAVLQEHKDVDVARIGSVLGVGGIYDLRALVECYPEYGDFVGMAFGEDQYDEASPSWVARARFEPAGHVRFGVFNSSRDELVHSSQSADFAAQLVRSKYPSVLLAVCDFGSHFGMLDNPLFWTAAARFILET